MIKKQILNEVLFGQSRNLSPTCTTSASKQNEIHQGFFIYFLVLWDCDAQNQEIYFFEICIQTKCSLYTDLQDATNIENAFMRVARELKSRYENGSQLQANIMDDAVILESRSVDSKWCGCG